MPNLTVPNATIYYETIGTGPLLFCISGANGSADIWRPLAQTLKTNFTTCIYDRRGFSRSYLTGPQDYTGSARIETDTDDIKALIEHLSPNNEPATILGNSSGAIVSLMLLQRHPSVVRTLIAHEPPAMSILPNREAALAEGQAIYDIYRSSGPIPAFQRFGQMVHVESDSGMRSMLRDPSEDPYLGGNQMYWFEREAMSYPFQEFDFEILKAEKAKLVLVVGRESHPVAPQRACPVVLGEKLGVEITWFSGGHIAFAAGTEVFAEELREVLKGRDEVYKNL